MTENMHKNPRIPTLALLAMLSASACVDPSDSASTRETGLEGETHGEASTGGTDTGTNPDTDSSSGTDSDSAGSPESLGTAYAHFEQGAWKVGKNPDFSENGDICDFDFAQAGYYAVQFSANPPGPNPDPVTFILASEYTPAYGPEGWGEPLYGFKLTPTETTFPEALPGQDLPKDTMFISDALAVHVFELVSDDPKVKLTRPNPTSTGILELTWSVDDQVWLYEGAVLADDEAIDFKPMENNKFQVIVNIESATDEGIEYYGALYYSRDSGGQSGLLVGQQQLFPFFSQTPTPNLTSLTFPGETEQVPKNEDGEHIFTVNLFTNLSYHATTGPC